ncbi:hypothetical protein VA249_45180 (plasmid) [Vibrio alfacsensis]|uniref:conjugal transfer protein TraF n=1 Tax=Vibrio alfacsensis TaxID=1074311 RepID=UPI001BF07265|nr:conjugal transfer protein TraF [Vibrio alfacsensis]BBM67872.1 hypothetical protein VA249_45180 [Vibrio alfacsensis]
MQKLLLPIAISFSLSAAVIANEQPDNANKQTLSNEVESENKYFNDSERGWYWYEQLPEEEKEKFLEKLQAELPEPEAAPTPTERKPEDEPLSSAWFRVNFQKYADAAMNNPYDKEAMRTYLYLEKFMRDRAVAFGMERQKAVMAEPFLDQTSTRPIANFGMKAMNVQASKNKDTLLSEMGKQTGLYFFYRGDDAFSTQQADLVAQLSSEFGFTVLPVSMDGSKPPSVLGEKFELNTTQAETLGIQVLPATYLFNPSNGVVELVGQGIHAVSDLKNRILFAALRSGLIDEQQYQLTKPSGLFVDANGYVTGGLQVPNNAPQEFLKLYADSMNNK